MLRLGALTQGTQGTGQVTERRARLASLGEFCAELVTAVQKLTRATQISKEV